MRSLRAVCWTRLLQSDYGTNTRSEPLGWCMWGALSTRRQLRSEFIVRVSISGFSSSALYLIPGRAVQYCIRRASQHHPCHVVCIARHLSLTGSLNAIHPLDDSYLSRILLTVKLSRSVLDTMGCQKSLETHLAHVLFLYGNVSCDRDRSGKFPDADCQPDSDI